MVHVSEIDGRQPLREWLEDKPQEWFVWMAHRASMRVAPLAWRWFQSKEARKHDLTALPILRSLLISGVAAVRLTPDVREAASSAYDSAAAAADLANGFAAHAALASAYASSAASHASAAALSVLDFASAAAPQLIWEVVRRDCDILGREGSGALGPLWPNGQRPFLEEWGYLKHSLPQATSGHQDETTRAPLPEDWSFWIRWYETALEGRPLNLDMLEEIALIPPETWDKGPGVVNPLIALIEEKYRIKAELEALEAKTAEAIADTQALPPRSHNQPPELIDEADDALEDLREMLGAVKVAREEVESRAPKTERLAKAGKVIARVGLALAKYCGGKTDIVVTEAAKKIGAGLGIAVVAITVVAATSGTLGPSIQDFATRWSAAQTHIVPAPQAPGMGATPAP